MFVLSETNLALNLVWTLIVLPGAASLAPPKWTS
jgi:hypothetical protein